MSDDSDALARWFDLHVGCGDAWWCPSCGRWGCWVGYGSAPAVTWGWMNHPLRRASGPCVVWPTNIPMTHREEPSS